MKTQPDLVQGWMYHGNLAALALGARDGVSRPVGWGIRQSLHGSRDKRTTKVVIRTSAALSARAAAIVYNSEAAKQQHEAAGFSSQRSAVIPNGFDPEALSPNEHVRANVRRQFGFDVNHFVIGHVARYHPSKDHRAFLLAASALSKHCPKARYLMAGDGIDESNPELIGLLNGLQLAHCVKLVGRWRDVGGLMPALDVLCLSSSGMEGFPNVVGEAMSCGVPCVSTDVGDARDVIGDTGLIAPPAQPEALAAALSTLSEMPTARRMTMGRAARERIKAKYSIASVANQYAELFSEVLRNDRAR